MHAARSRRVAQCHMSAAGSANEEGREEDSETEKGTREIKEGGELQINYDIDDDMKKKKREFHPPYSPRLHVGR
jgi:hypothetical protein